MIDTRKLTGRDHAIGATLGIIYVAALLHTAPDLAMSRDESFYVYAAKNIAGWLSELLTDPASALDRDHIARAWRYNWEHPAWMKLMFAWSWCSPTRVWMCS